MTNPEATPPLEKKSRSEDNMVAEGSPPHLLSDDIALRAYEIWCDEGCPEGRALDHWLRAEQEKLGMLEH